MIYLTYNSNGFQYKPIKTSSNSTIAGPVEKKMISEGTYKTGGSIGGSIYQVGKGIEGIKFKSKKPTNNIKFIL